MRGYHVAVLVCALGVSLVLSPCPSAGGIGTASARARHQSHARPHFQGVVVHVVQTTGALSERLKPLPDMLLRRGWVTAPRSVRVQDGIRYQRILGFGATLTDSAAWLVRYKLAASGRDRLIRLLFGSKGIGLNYLRLPMGASDFTAKGRPYSFDDMPPGESDPSLSRFSVDHDASYIIPTLRRALSINPAIFLIANPWSAPPWMKTNQASDDFGNAGTLLPADYGPFADYFVRFLKSYRSHGVVVRAVAPQNEPGVAEDPGMNLSEPDETTFVAQYLRPSLAAAGLSTEIYGLDMGWDMLPYADALATGPARGDLSGISWHCYYGSPTAMTQIHALAPQLSELVNECSPEIRPFSTAVTLIASLRNWASAVALWNLALDSAGGPVQSPGKRCPHCGGLVTINQRTHRVFLTSRYYQLGQVSKFVARGAVRIASNTFVSDETAPNGFYVPTPGLDDVAFLDPDGEKVLVTYNSERHPVSFALSWRGLALRYREPAGATTTFTWR